MSRHHDELDDHAPAPDATEGASPLPGTAGAEDRDWREAWAAELRGRLEHAAAAEARGDAWGISLTDFEARRRRDGA